MRTDLKAQYRPTMSTDEDQGGLSPFFRRYFFPYGSNLHKGLLSRVSHSPSHSTTVSQRSVRSLSISSKKTELLRQRQQASIIELFGREFVRITLLPVALLCSQL